MFKRERKENVSREALHEQVWANAMGKVAARYGISDVMLARVCKRLQIPHPGRGYWAKLEAGRAPDPAPLPAAKPGEPVEWVRDGGRAKTAPVPLPQAPDASAPLVKHKRISTKGRHRLLVDVEKDFLNTRSSDNGFLRPYKYSLPDISVSKDHVLEGLDVASKVYRTFEAYDFRVELGGRSYHRPDLSLDGKREKRDPRVIESYSSRHATVAFVGTLAIGVFVFEQTEDVPAEYDRTVMGYVRTDMTTPGFRKRQLHGHYISTHAMPSGKYGVWVYSPYQGVEWTKSFLEKQRGQLGGNLGKTIVKAVVAEASSLAARNKVEEEKREKAAREAEARWEKYKAEEAERERKELEAERVRREREARERREALEKQSRAELVSIIDDWLFSAKVGSFIESIEKVQRSVPKAERAALQERLRLVRELFGEKDPMKRLLRWETAEEREKAVGSIEDDGPSSDDDVGETADDDDD